MTEASAGLGSSSPLIARLTAEGKPARRLSSETRRAVERFLSSGYTETPNPCLCGSTEDRLIARRDRFGIPLDTRLCTGCGLMRSDPYMDDASIARFYAEVYRDINTRGWMELSASESFESQRWAGRQIIEWLDRSDSVAREGVFEIGCGGGGILQSFAERGSRVIGCDFDDRYLEEGRRAGLDLRTGSTETLENAGQADLVILSHVLEHFRDPVSMLESIPPLLKPDGLLYVEVPGVLDFRGMYRVLDSFLVNAHVWHFSLATLDYTMALAGFSRVRGDEFVRALYRPSPSVVARPESAAADAVLEYIERTERLRFVPRFGHPIAALAPIARRVFGRRLYRAASRLYARGTRG